jgi:2-methylcitrate dehydratase PrpD
MEGCRFLVLRRAFLISAASKFRGGERARATHPRPSANGPRRAAKRARGGNAPRRPHHQSLHPPGTKENPLSTERVNEKARSLMAPVLGAERTEEVIRLINELEKLDDVRKLRPLLAG